MQRKIVSEKEMVLRKLKEMGSSYSLCNISDDLKTDKTFMLDALKYNKKSIKYFSKELLRDREIMSFCFRNTLGKFVIDYVDVNDKEIILLALENDFDIYDKISKELQNDQDIISERARILLAKALDDDNRDIEQIILIKNSLPNSRYKNLGDMVKKGNINIFFRMIEDLVSAKLHHILAELCKYTKDIYTQQDNLSYALGEFIDKKELSKATRLLRTGLVDLNFVDKVSRRIPPIEKLKYTDDADIKRFTKEYIGEEPSKYKTENNSILGSIMEDWTRAYEIAHLISAPTYESIKLLLKTSFNVSDEDEEGVYNVFKDIVIKILSGSHTYKSIPICEFSYAPLPEFAQDTPIHESGCFILVDILNKALKNKTLYLDQDIKRAAIQRIKHNFKLGYEWPIFAVKEKFNISGREIKDEITSEDFSTMIRKMHFDVIKKVHDELFDVRDILNKNECEAGIITTMGQPKHNALTVRKLFENIHIIKEIFPDSFQSDEYKEDAKIFLDYLVSKKWMVRAKDLINLFQLKDINIDYHLI